ncbi:MAG: hypothetical protein HUU28_01640 [Planctomycetaceae bacterium]|nr:hypothetical protein [Planctomycetaceae bacterium]
MLEREGFPALVDEASDHSRLLRREHVLERLAQVLLRNPEFPPGNLCFGLLLARDEPPQRGNKRERGQQEF